MNKLAQIKLILSEYKGYCIESDKKNKLWCAFLRKRYKKYDEIFSITHLDVYNYVIENGWGDSIVHEINSILELNEEEASGLCISPIEKEWAVFSLHERGEKESFGFFSDIASARLHVVKILVGRQWSFWNSEWRDNNWPKEKELPWLRDIFPPPPNLTYEDLR